MVKSRMRRVDEIHQRLGRVDQRRVADQGFRPGVLLENQQGAALLFHPVEKRVPIQFEGTGVVHGRQNHRQMEGAERVLRADGFHADVESFQQASGLLDILPVAGVDQGMPVTRRIVRDLQMQIESGRLSGGMKLPEPILEILPETSPSRGSSSPNASNALQETIEVVFEHRLPLTRKQCAEFERRINRRLSAV